MGLSRHRVAALLSCALAGIAPMQTPAGTPGALTVSEAWSRPTPPGLGVGAVYLSIHNSGVLADRLLGASSPAADKIEFHQTRQRGAMTSMREVPFIECPAGATVKISSGGLHIMLLGLKSSLAVGSSFPVTLQFSHAGQISVNVSVQVDE